MYKRYLLTFILVFATTCSGWGAKNENQIGNLVSAWGAAYWKSCKAHDTSNDAPCIGASRNNCQAQSVENPQYPGDEYGVLMMVATATSSGGAYFCPMMINGANENKKASVWTEYYQAGNNCVWLCKEGKMGPKCEQDASSNVTSCDTTLLRQNDYDNIKPVGGNTKPNIEDQIPNWGANFYKECWGNVDQEHDLILAISNWVPSGHGAFVRPYIIRVERDGWKEMKSWIEVYPASSVQFSDTTNTEQVLACKNGYKPNTSHTDCIAVNENACGEVNWCSGWDWANFDETLHTKVTVGNCIQWRCKDEDTALTSAGSKNCEECTRNTLTGIDPNKGTCKTCPKGKMFSDTATNSDYCAETIYVDTNMLKYGPKGSANSPIDEQCWTIENIDEYKTCVTGEEVSVSTNQVKAKTDLKVNPNLKVNKKFNTQLSLSPEAMKAKTNSEALGKAVFK